MGIFGGSQKKSTVYGEKVNISDRARAPYFYKPEDSKEEKKLEEFSQTQINIVLGIIRLAILSNWDLDITLSLLEGYFKEIASDLKTVRATDLFSNLLEEALEVLTKDLERTGDNEEKGPFFEEIMISLMGRLSFDVLGEYSGKSDTAYRVSQNMSFEQFLKAIGFARAREKLLYLQRDALNGFEEQYSEWNKKRSENDAEHWHQTSDNPRPAQAHVFPDKVEMEDPEKGTEVPPKPSVNKDESSHSKGKHPKDESSKKDEAGDQANFDSKSSPKTEKKEEKSEKPKRKKENQEANPNEQESSFEEKVNKPTKVLPIV